MGKSIYSLNKTLIAGSFIGLFWTVPVLAQQSKSSGYRIDQSVGSNCSTPGSYTQNQLNQARVCGFGGSVNLSPGGVLARSTLGSVLNPPVRLVTQSKSAAQLKFNEGTVARFLPEADFTFRKGPRDVLLNRSDIQIISKQTRSFAIATKETYTLNGRSKTFAQKDLGIADKIKTPMLRQNLVKTEAFAQKDLGITNKIKVPTFLPYMVESFAQEKSIIKANETIFELKEGTVLSMNPPSSLLTEIITPQSEIAVAAALSVPADQRGRGGETLTAAKRSSAVIVRHESAKNTTQVFSLTNSSIRVTSLQGGNTVILQGGETVSVTNGVVGTKQVFDLLRFYQTTELANGLGPGQEQAIGKEPVEIQQTIRKVRVETLSALEDQRTRLEGRSGTPGDLPLIPNPGRTNQ